MKCSALLSVGRLPANNSIIIIIIYFCTSWHVKTANGIEERVRPTTEEEKKRKLRARTQSGKGLATYKAMGCSASYAAEVVTVTLLTGRY